MSKKTHQKEQPKKHASSGAANQAGTVTSQNEQLDKSAIPADTENAHAPASNVLPTTGLDGAVERWQAAQKSERAAHEADPNNTAEHYAKVYKKYFEYVGLGTNLEGLHVVEIGPAYHPALAICSNYAKSVIIEPMVSHELIVFCKDNDVVLIDTPLEMLSGAERLIFEEMEGVIEVWLFNVLQHVIDPNTFVQRCKSIAGRIRFFEPVNVPVAEHHPHTFGNDDFIEWFGLGTQFYKGGSGGAGFHTADCAYGVWINGE